MAALSSLKVRIAATIFVLEGLMMGFTLWQVLGALHVSVEQQVLTQEQVTLDLLHGMALQALVTEEFSELQPTFQSLQRDQRIVRAVLGNEKGRVVAASNPADLGTRLPELSPGTGAYWRSRDVGRTSGRLGTLALEFSRAPLEAANAGARNLGIMIAAICMIFIAVVGVGTGWLLTRRLDLLRRAAQRVAAGETGVRTGLRGGDEVALLSRSFDDMASAVAQQQSKLKEQSEYIELLLDSTSEAFYGADADGICTFVNPACLRMLGFQREDELIGKSIHELIHHTYPDGRPYPKEQCRVRMASLQGEAGHADDEVHWRADGSSFPVEYWSHPMYRDGQFIGSVVAFIDITERKQKETALRIKDSAVAASLNGIAFADLDGTVTYVNQAFLRMWGYRDAHEVVGGSATEFWREPAKAALALGAVGKGEAWSGELTGRRKDGSLFESAVSAVMIRDEAGEPVQLMASFVDITEARQAADKLTRMNEELESRVQQRTVEIGVARDEAQRANEAKSEFLSRMSHELRTPLNAILGFGQLLELEVLEREQADSVREILHAGQHLLDLINEVLDLARIESGKFTVSLEPVALAPLLAECLTMIGPQAHSRGIGVLELGGECAAQVLADRTRLKQVLLNLLSNAVKYNREGGTLGIDCELEADADAIRIRVSDTGPGLTPEQQARLFVPFERLGADQSAVEGAGIGLALSKRLVEHMQGQIGVQSTPGTGSVFWVRLPLAGGQLDASHGAQAAQSKDLVPERTGHKSWEVLCIEDNPANLRLIERILARRGDIRLLTASAPGLGLELARSHRPALILLDINLPDMDGYAVLQCLRENPATRDIPVLAISANAMPADLERGRAAGFAGYLTKPLDIARATRIVYAILDPDHSQGAGRDG